MISRSASGEGGTLREDDGVGPLILATIVFGALSILCGRLSAGFLEADACTHYLMARWALETKWFLTDAWGRPLVKLLHVLPAVFGGRVGVQLVSLGCAVTVAVCALQVARRLGYRYPAAAAIFVFAQPLVFLHSFSEMTELPFAALMAVALVAYQSRRFLLTTILVSLSPLARPEGFGFVLLMFAALVLHRKWWWAFLLPIPTILWSAAGWHLRPDYVPSDWWNWLIRTWPFEVQSNYGRGKLDHFLWNLPVVVGPLLMPLLVIGTVISIRRFKLFGDHAARTETVILSIAWGVLLVHSVLWYLGKFSGGELRYMMVVSVFWALICARGFEWAWSVTGWRWAYSIAGALAILGPLAANLKWQVVPLRESEDLRVAREIREWISTNGVADGYPRIMSPHPAIWYVLDVNPADATKVVMFRREFLEEPADGVILIWEPLMAKFNSDNRASAEMSSVVAGGWRFAASFGTEWKVFLSPSDKDGKLTRWP